MSHFFLDARTATPHFPGIGRYVRNLATALVPLLAGDEHLTLLWDPSTPGAWNPAGLAGDRVTVLPAPVSPFGLAQQWRIPKMINAQWGGGRRARGESQPLSHSPTLPLSQSPLSQSPIPNPQSPIFHSPYYLMPYTVPRLARMPVVLTFYDLIPLRFPELVSAQARLLFRIAMRLALRSARHIIAISEAARRDLIADFGVDPARVTAIPLAPDPRFRPQSQAEIRRVRDKYGLPDSFLLYLGINKPHKNLVRLMDAYAQLPPFATRNSPLLIAGAWDDRYPESKQRASALDLGDRVRFLGRVDDGDLPGLYAAATLFVFPSRYEGFGLPVVEAMACGTPVACSNASSQPEAAGDAALLFDPDDTAAITAALERGLADGDQRRDLSARGLVQSARFTWGRNASATLGVYRGFLG